jgi:hypothetical protein
MVRQALPNPIATEHINLHQSEPSGNGLRILILMTQSLTVNHTLGIEALMWSLGNRYQSSRCRAQNLLTDPILDSFKDSAIENLSREEMAHLFGGCGCMIGLDGTEDTFQHLSLA